VADAASASEIPYLASFFKSSEDGGEIGPENLRQISAFLDEDGWKPQPRDGRTDASESLGGHCETRKGIML
jgi:hypothetical protein